MADDFTNQTIRTAIQQLDDGITERNRTLEDAQRWNDPETAAAALVRGNSLQLEKDRLIGADRGQQQQQDQLLDSEIQFLNRRAALGDDWRTHPQDYVQASARALAAGLQRGSPQHLKAVEMAVESMGDGRQSLLNERSAAEICGVDEATYAAGAIELARRKRSGHYQD